MLDWNPARVALNWLSRLRVWLLTRTLVRRWLAAGIPGTLLVSAVLLVSAAVVLYLLSPRATLFLMRTPWLVAGFLAFGILQKLLLWLALKPWSATFFQTSDRIGTSLGGYFDLWAFGAFLRRGEGRERFVPFVWNEGSAYFSERETRIQLAAWSLPQQPGAFVAEQVLDLAVDNAFIEWGTATLGFTRIPALRVAGREYRLLALLRGPSRFEHPAGAAVPEAEPTV